ncbi:MAG: glutathione synthase [Nitrospirae bacterium CG_4_8_14_3_um_filter_70_85]|nr:MAG: glutathione synthase [Nitrospirae bacterium CG06_land_8_20_14_3_00_70_43]PIW83601.1 MAG: glutathione synthase [Nitrospirae bacterium CG_4_8_14_3_um_filter_70_85]PIX84187.1 MAG: glutathione synthase [Nitrospirae bacterium CG_4_10_14_3_um_filter_70_108]
MPTASRRAREAARRSITVVLPTPGLPYNWIATVDAAVRRSLTFPAAVRGFVFIAYSSIPSAQLYHFCGSPVAAGRSPLCRRSRSGGPRWPPFSSGPSGRAPVGVVRWSMASRPLIGVVMDPPSTLHYEKDSTYALMEQGTLLGARFEVITLDGLYGRAGHGRALAHPVAVVEPPAHLRLGEAVERPLSDYACVLMRKDPPFDLDYLCATYCLSLAPCPVINDPGALRDANEKMVTLRFPEWSPETLATAAMARILAFVEEFGAAVIKPPDAMGGRGVFLLRPGDPNLRGLVEEATGHGRHYAVVQRYLPEVVAGDKRVLLWDGEVVGAVNRLPPPGELRANLAAGAWPQATELSARETALCADVGPRLAAEGLRLVGLDLIGEHLTEVNVTSPTGMREVERLTGISPARQIMERLLAEVG